MKGRYNSISSQQAHRLTSPLQAVLIFNFMDTKNCSPFDFNEF